MSQLPRVTYSNIAADFTPLHDYLDQLIPQFESETLGQTWQTPFATKDSHQIASPIDPALSLGTFPRSSAADVDAAVKTARAAAKTWNHSTLEERLAFADRWQAVLDEEKYRLGLAGLFEVGKSRLESIGETEEAVDMVAYYAGQLKKNNGFDRPMLELVEHETTRSVLRPYGVFAVIAPFNFPVALAVGPMVCALLAGNAVVYKPSPECSLTGLMLAETLKKAGLPDGVFNIVLGGGDVGQALTEHDGIDGVAFTGSHATGMGIFRKMGEGRWMKPVLAEMGGKNPAYVTKNADLPRAAQGVIRSAFGLQGQKCSACSVVYVDEAVKDEFVKECKAFAGSLKIGDVRERDTFLGPVYDDRAGKRFANSVAQAKKDGKVLFGGDKVSDRDGNYVTPAIVEFDGPHDLTRTELFMPFLAVRAVSDLKAALPEGNDVQYGLCAGVFTQDQDELNYFLDHAEAGVLYANRASGATTGAWPGSQPFCGWKGTGLSGKGGLGTYYLQQFMREQSHTIMTV